MADQIPGEPGQIQLDDADLTDEQRALIEWASGDIRPDFTHPTSLHGDQAAASGRALMEAALGRARRSDPGSGWAPAPGPRRAPWHPFAGAERAPAPADERATRPRRPGPGPQPLRRHPRSTLVLPDHPRLTRTPAPSGPAPPTTFRGPADAGPLTCSPRAQVGRVSSDGTRTEPGIQKCKRCVVIEGLGDHGLR